MKINLQPKHMLWVLKRTISIRRFFQHQKHIMFKQTDKENFTILHLKF